MALDQKESRRARLTPLACVLLVATLVAGCGGSSLSNDQLHTEAARICSLTTVRTNRIPTPSSPAASATFLDRGIAALTPELEGLQALHPSGDDADVYKSTVKTFAAKVRALKGAERGIDRGDDPVRTLQELQRKLGPLEAQENGGWDALQLPACETQ
jgi:hypothetical protein